MLEIHNMDSYISYNDIEDLSNYRDDPLVRAKTDLLWYKTMIEDLTQLDPWNDEIYYEIPTFLRETLTGVVG